MTESKEQLLKERRQKTLKKTRIKNAIILIIFILMISYLFFCVFTMTKNITTRIMNKEATTSLISNPSFKKESC
ncbi:hypothetical protein [Clostridium sp. UBA6640]|uniref:hypothetical protein n=1 Tax=Clostridium sp. UBA6640 TaxID=1946370 RepID=UPI0025BE72FC|nr:hypothetical protein [Clostridium sp. UBA6640]